MDAKEPLYVVCQNGVFTLPDHLFRTLSARSNGFVYLRQDEDSLTVSTTRLNGGQRRVLNARLRSPMFREAIKLGVVNLNDSIQLIAVEWRVNATARVRRESPPAAQ
ncbi:MAG: hypothetical protein M3Q69_07915 [Acidobacteriota bacterium]|nr:hypothetical protein [Acidobacteriota bacterium]